MAKEDIEKTSADKEEISEEEIVEDEEDEEIGEESEDATSAEQPEREMTKIKCSECGKDAEVPFKPTEGRPVYCRECFSKHRKPRRNFGYRRF